GTVTADSNGYAYFYALPGLYRITSNRPAIDWPDVSLAAPVVNVGGETYPDTAAGLAATGDGEYFTVPSSDAAGYLDLYLNDAGTAEYVDTYPNLEAAQEAIAAAEAAIGAYGIAYARPGYSFRPD